VITPRVNQGPGYSPVVSYVKLQMPK
jgi:hypothetical protein